MPHVNLTALDAVTLLDCDICIIGTGPAASTIARELSNSTLKITVLESGSFERQEHVDALYQIDNIGASRKLDQWLVRNRLVGGSSHTWTGRCAPFDEIDFEKREWVPHSGWPFGLDLLATYLSRAAPYLGLGIGNGFSDDRFWELANRLPPAKRADTSYLLSFFWEFSRDESSPYDYMRFGRRLLSHLGENVTLVTNANVLEILTNENGSAVTSVKVASSQGNTHKIAAKTVVLCTGGIENARILLSSDTLMRAGLGNQHDVVGRFLMDHPRDPIGHFPKMSRGLQKRFGLYKVKTAGGDNLFRHGLRLSPEVQRREHLLNCSSWLGEVVTDDDPWNSIKRLLRGKGDLRADAMKIASNAGLFARGLHSYFIARNGLPRKLERLDLMCMLEQVPDPSSRVTLSTMRDSYGMRLSQVDWRIHDEEARTARRMAELVKEQFTLIGEEPPVLADWVTKGEPFPKNSFEDIAHPTGTTRISDDPREGVVDRNCQVHGIRGLYVAGSSTFPTAGHCNPTHMLVALAIRIADELRQKVASDTSRIGEVRLSPSPDTRRDSGVAVAPHSQRRVLVTGGSGRIGTHLLKELRTRGYLVRALTSNRARESNFEHDGLEWRYMDFQEGLDFSTHVEGCSAILHLGGEITNMNRMERVNIEATRALAKAGEKAGVRFLCYTSSVAAYGSSLTRNVDEQSPLLTPDKDIKAEYWAEDSIRKYGRTKLLGEKALSEEVKNMECVIVRPTVVVDVRDLLELGNWSSIKKNLAGHRHTHHIYVADVVDAILWFMEKSLSAAERSPGVSVYNLSEDEVSDSTYYDFFTKIYARSGDPRFKTTWMPWALDWLRDFVKFRSLPLRHPLGRMFFSSAKLASAGYRPRYGMRYARELAFEELRKRHGADAL